MSVANDGAKHPSFQHIKLLSTDTLNEAALLLLSETPERGVDL